MSQHQCVFFSDADETATDIPVSLDGSWELRRMDSRFGFVTAGSVDTVICVPAVLVVCPGPTRKGQMSTWTGNFRID